MCVCVCVCVCVYSITTASAQEDYKKATRYQNQERRSAGQDSTLKRNDSRKVLINKLVTFFVLKPAVAFVECKERRKYFTKFRT